MFSGTKNRNEGTFGCSPVPRAGMRAHSPKPPFFETALLVSSRQGGADSHATRDPTYLLRHSSPRASVKGRFLCPLSAGFDLFDLFLFFVPLWLLKCRFSKKEREKYEKKEKYENMMTRERLKFLGKALRAVP